MDLSLLLKEWNEETLNEHDETLMLLDEIKRVESLHQQVLNLSSDLEEAYYQWLRKIQS